MIYRSATPEDIDQVLTLHFRYHVAFISEADKSGGFVTTPFNAEELHALITREKGLFVAEKEGAIVAYVMAASWEFWSAWPMFAYMAERLETLKYKGVRLSTENSYQYGPVCIDAAVRGSGVFEALFSFALKAMRCRYAILVTFINRINTRSFAAHTRKVGLEVIAEFEYNDNRYYELVCSTAPELSSEPSTYADE